MYIYIKITPSHYSIAESALFTQRKTLSTTTTDTTDLSLYFSYSATGPRLIGGFSKNAGWDGYYISHDDSGYSITTCNAKCLITTDCNNFIFRDDGGCFLLKEGIWLKE